MPQNPHHKSYYTAFHEQLTITKMAGTGVLADECRPDRNLGAWPSLAVTNKILELTKRVLLAAPNADADTIIGMITNPAVPSVSFPNGCKQRNNKT